MHKSLNDQTGGKLAQEISYTC